MESASNRRQAAVTPTPFMSVTREPFDGKDFAKSSLRHFTPLFRPAAAEYHKSDEELVTLPEPEEETALLPPQEAASPSRQVTRDPRALAIAARQHLLDDRPTAAAKLLRGGLTSPSQPLTPAARAALLNDLALCALHDGRPSDAIDPLRHALALLPLPPSRPTESSSDGGVGSSSSSSTGSSQKNLWAMRSRAQLQINLCEALLLKGGSLKQTRREALEAVRTAQHAQDFVGGGSLTARRDALIHGTRTPRSGRGSSSSSSPTRGNRMLPRLFTARWLLPPEGIGSKASASAVSETGDAEDDDDADADAAKITARGGDLDGCLPSGELLVLAWLWAALANESMGKYHHSLQCYSRGLEVAQVRRAVACRQHTFAPPPHHHLLLTTTPLHSLPLSVRAATRGRRWPQSTA